MQLTAAFYAAEIKSADLGTPQNIEIIGSDVEEADKFNSFQVSFTNDGSVFRAAKGYTLKLDWRIRLSVANDWHEVIEFVSVEKVKKSTVGLFYIQPGNIDAFKVAQSELYETLAPALSEFKLWSGEKGLCFDRDNFSMEIQLRYRAEKEGSEAIIGKWSDSALFGLATINGETPNSLIGKPDLTSLEYSFVNESGCNIKFAADIPQSITRYKQSIVGDLKLTAQVDFGRQGFWYEFFSEKIGKTDFKKPIEADINLADTAKLKQYEDSSFPDSTSKITTPITVRIRCEWYSKNTEKSEEEKAVPELITEWTEMSVEVSGSSGIATKSEATDDEGGLSVVVISAIAFAAAVAVVCAAVLIQKRKKQKKQ